jgi:hypothetical protein
MLLGKGQPPEDLLGQLALWWHTSIVGYGNVTWGALVVGIALVMFIGWVATR